MNPSTTSELSLYQLTQTTEPHLSPLIVSASTFREWVDTAIQFLIDEEIQATVWAKLPPNSRWWTNLENYYQEGLPQQIYRCTISRSGGTAPSRHGSHTAYPSQDNFTPIVLETNTQLRREHFCLILSPQLCCLILAQEQISADEDPPSGLLEPTVLKGVYSFNPTIIQKVLSGIKHLITITDTTPVEVLGESVLAFPLPSTMDATLLTKLWSRCLLPRSSVNPYNLPETSQPLPPKNLTLGEEFLKPLTTELSTPLTNMKTALRLLESKQHKRDIRQRYIDLLKKECDRQNTLLTGLQELLQLNQSLNDAEPIVHLEEVVPGIVSTYQAIAEEKGIMLGYTIPPGFPPVACPNVWLRRILQNIIHNSLKFTPKGGRITVQAALKSEGVEISVADTGMGIEQSDLPKLFDSFYRGRNTLNRDIEGVGLGLTIAHHLIEQCGGKIDIVSQVGKGTIVKVVFQESSD
ncbi:probable two-component sensor histidine kinase [Crocosphaera subtropica ATCC 51142]|uniref:histidine kinase n=1 Tax=Crocosphaera subtropica (strain ATCC 51142 / BH68) TaxID=43989 RepID=B1WZP6_CROS5|nr:DICT sensory domain-containing protein [Crocosphaera subtropica]ACB51198.1 probable two-component sensor histidine kinase [Crocosphaera subtropica ATCC 51142]